MTDTSARLALPLLQPGQAQKELTHNEALALLDLAVQASVVAIGLDAPPSAPEPGQAWVVGTTPVAAWAAHARAVAGWTEGGWRFVAAREGMAVWSSADAMAARFVDGGWRLGLVSGTGVAIDGTPVIGAQRAAIPDVAGGAVVDTEARATLGAILVALRGHGLIAS